LFIAIRVNPTPPHAKQDMRIAVLFDLQPETSSRELALLFGPSGTDAKTGKPTNAPQERKQ
jgi:hypothetical protein